MIPSKGGSSARRSSIGSNNSRDVKGDNNAMEGTQHFQDDGHSTQTNSPVFNNVADPEDRMPSASLTEHSNASTINWLYSQKASLPVHSVLSEASQVLSAGSTATTTSSMLQQGSAHMLSTLEPRGNMVHTLVTLHEEWQGPQHTYSRMGTARQKAYVSPLDLILVGVKIDTHHTIHDLKPTFREDLQVMLTETLEQLSPRCSLGIARATARPGCIQLVLELLCHPDTLASREASTDDGSGFLLRSVVGSAPTTEEQPAQLASTGREKLIRLLAETLAVQAVQALQLDTKELKNGHQVEVQVEDYVCTAIWDSAEQLWRTSSAKVDPHKFHLDAKQPPSGEKQAASPNKVESSSGVGIKAKVTSVSVVPTNFRSSSVGPYQPLASDGIVDAGNEDQDVLASTPEPRSRSMPVGASAVTAATLASVAAAANPNLNPNGLLLFVKLLLPAGMRIEGFQPRLHASSAIADPNPTKADTSSKPTSSQTTEQPLQLLVSYRGAYCVSRIVNFWTGPNVLATSPPSSGNVKAEGPSSEATTTPTTTAGHMNLIKAWALVEVLPPDPTLSDPTTREQSLPEPLLLGIGPLEQLSKQQQAPFTSALSGSTSGGKSAHPAADVAAARTSVDAAPAEDAAFDPGARHGSVIFKDYGSSAGGSEVPQPWLPRMLLLELWRGSKLLNSHTCVMHGALVEQPVPRFLPSAHKIPAVTPVREVAPPAEELQGSSTKKPPETNKEDYTTAKEDSPPMHFPIQPEPPTSLPQRAHSENIQVMNSLMPTIGRAGLFDPPPPAQLDVRQSARGSDVSFSLFSTAELELDPVFLRDLGLFVALMERDPSMQQATNPAAIQTIRQLACLGPSLLLHALECELFSTVEVLMHHMQRLDWRLMAGVPPSDPPLTELEQDRLRTALEAVTATSNAPPHPCFLHLNDWLFDMNMQHEHHPSSH